MAGGFESLGLSEELIRAVEGDLNWLLPTVRYRLARLTYTRPRLVSDPSTIPNPNGHDRTCKTRASRSSWAAGT